MQGLVPKETVGTDLGQKLVLKKLIQIKFPRQKCKDDDVWRLGGRAKAWNISFLIVLRW